MPTLFQRGKMLGALICNGILILLSAAGLVMDFVQMGTYSFIYFSDAVNVLALISSAVCLGFLIRNLTQKQTDLPRAVKVFRSTVTSLLVFLFMLVVLVLGPTSGYMKMMLEGSNLYLNFLVPVLSFFSLVMFEQEPELRLREIWWTPAAALAYGAVVAPLVYFGYLPAPYELFDVSIHEIWEVLLVGFLMLAASFFVSWLVYLCDKRSGPGEDLR